MTTSKAAIAALAIAAGLAATPARAGDFDRMIAAFDCSMIAKYATTEADSLRLFEIGKTAGIQSFQKQADLFVELPREHAIYFSLGSWWAARAQIATDDATKQGKTDFGEGFQLNSSEGFKVMREQYRLRNCGLTGEAGGRQPNITVAFLISDARVGPRPDGLVARATRR